MRNKLKSQEHELNTVDKSGMVCLTGDVHHMSLKNDDQKFLKGSEVDSALRYIEISNSYDIKATIFLTGKAIKEDKNKAKRILQYKNVELGGHNYFAFHPRRPFNISKRLFNRANGPKWFQECEIRRTKRTFRSILNYKIKSWRDHAFRHDENTAHLLAKNGIKYFSDVRGPQYNHPFQKEGLMYVPLNVLPDHSYVYHGARQPGTFNENVLLKTPFQTRAMSVEMWKNEVIRSVKEIVNNGGVATILAHPACMEIFDDFKTFEELCLFLSDYKVVKMSEL